VERRDHIEAGLDQHGLIGGSPAFVRARQVAARVARRRSTVMIHGETGSGKEMLARYVHRLSNRAGRPFIPVDCSSISDSLFESELFGHVRGAFTGAVKSTLGFFRAADGGTLFLDEVGELSAPHQAKLLRVLQERRVVPVGETRSYPVDVRVITATHRDLADMVRRGVFRQDLFFRLQVVTLDLPPLRERVEDVLPLCEHFLNAQASVYDEPSKTLSPGAAAALEAYAWPGNVRELANVMERVHVLAAGERIEPADLPPEVLGRGGAVAVDETVSDLRLANIERAAIAEALRRARSNKAAASRLLGINIQRLNRRMRKLGLAGDAAARRG
jgi:two-component system response regulator PilR (NtrC family)